MLRSAGFAVQECAEGLDDRRRAFLPSALRTALGSPKRANLQGARALRGTPGLCWRPRPFPLWPPVSDASEASPGARASAHDQGPVSPSFGHGSGGHDVFRQAATPRPP